MSKYTLRAVLIPKANTKGEFPVRICLTVNRRRTYKSTGVNVLPKDWNEEECKIRKSVPGYNALNQKIANALSDFSKDLNKREANNEIISINSIRKPVGSVYLVNYFENLIPELRREESTKQNYKSTLDKLKHFAPNATFDDVDTVFLRRFENHLGKSLSQNTIHKVWKIFKMVFNAANSDGVTKNYPFKLYKNPKYEQTDRTFLLHEEVQAIEKILLGPLPDYLRVVINYFLLGCYSGLRFSDWQRFNYEGFVQGSMLIVRAKKNGELVSLDMKGNDLLFAVVERLKTMGPVMSEPKTNIYLKSVGRLAGLKKVLTTHVARHSFAIRCAELDILPNATAEYMGITLKSVMAYYKIIPRKLHSEFAKWNTLK